MEDCLQFNDLNRQDEAIEKLYDLSEKARNRLKLPLSQQTLEEFL